MSTATVAADTELSIESRFLKDASVTSAECDAPQSWLTKTVQQAVLRRLSRLQGGQIYLDDKCHRHVLGQPGPDELYATVTVNSPDFYRRLAAGGSLGAAEAYMDGQWDCDDLPGLVRIFSRNLDNLQSNGSRASVVTRTAVRAAHWLTRNTRAGSQRNIQAHYDLGNQFFELFLDPSMMYSAAMFDRSDMTLEDAQIARLDRVCQRLELLPSDHLVEIGTGWGGLAQHAAANYGCRVTTATISKNQYEYAVRRIASAGLQHRVTVLLQDYRDLSGEFDKLVSLEMVEAVGPQFYDDYFAKCAQLLKPAGQMLLQAIVMPEQRYAKYLKSVDFIQKYIFPGGSLPSITAMQQSVARSSQLRLLAIDDFADGYARTLRAWRHRFHQRLDDVRKLGYPERFIRMWDYYFAYCEGAFEERAVGVVQAMWGR